MSPTTVKRNAARNALRERKSDEASQDPGCASRDRAYVNTGSRTSEPPGLTGGRGPAVSLDKGLAPGASPSPFRQPPSVAPCPIPSSPSPAASPPASVPISARPAARASGPRLVVIGDRAMIAARVHAVEPSVVDVIDYPRRRPGPAPPKSSTCPGRACRARQARRRQRPLRARHPRPAIAGCTSGEFAGMVTAPVHKGHHLRCRRAVLGPHRIPGRSHRHRHWW